MIKVKKIIILLLVVLLTGCGLKKIEMNHYEIDHISYMFPLNINKVVTRMNIIIVIN